MPSVVARGQITIKIVYFHSRHEHTSERNNTLLLHTKSLVDWCNERCPKPRVRSNLVNFLGSLKILQ